MKQVHVVCENQSKEIGRFIVVMPEGYTTKDVLEQAYLQHPYLRSNENARIYVDGVPVPRKMMGQQQIIIKE